MEVGPAVSLEAWRRSRALLAAELGWGGLVVSCKTQGPPDTGQLGGSEREGRCLESGGPQSPTLESGLYFPEPKKRAT